MIEKLEELDFKRKIKDKNAQFVDFVLFNGIKTFNGEYNG